MTLTEKIGRGIKKYRQAKKLTQEELAFRTSLHQSTIYQIENGIRRINSEQLEKISEALGAPAIVFFQEKDAGDEFDNQELLELITELSEEQKIILVDVLKKLKSEEDFDAMRKAVELISIAKKME